MSNRIKPKLSDFGGGFTGEYSGYFQFQDALKKYYAEIEEEEDEIKRLEELELEIRKIRVQEERNRILQEDVEVRKLEAQARILEAKAKINNNDSDNNVTMGITKEYNI